MIPPELHKHMKVFETEWNNLRQVVHGLVEEERVRRFNQIVALDRLWLQWPLTQREEAWKFYYGGPKPKPLKPLVERDHSPIIFPDFKTAF